MAKVTQHNALLAYFKQNIVLTLQPDHRSTKYTVFLWKRGDGDVNIYLGKKGAVKVGETVAKARPMHERQRRNLIAKGTKIVIEQSIK